MSFPIRRALVLSLLVLGLNGPARAAMTFSYGPFALSGPDAGSTVAITIPQYDAAMYGPLQNVQFAFTGVTNTPISIAFENLANQAIRFGFFPYVGFDIKTTNFDSPPAQPFPPSPPFPPFPTPSMPLGAYKGVEDFTGSDSLTTQVSFGTGTDTRTVSNVPGYSDFIGTGSVTLQISESLLIHETSTITASLPAYKFLTAGTLSGNLTVTYNVPAVPEPSSLSMASLGSLLVLAGQRTRRRFFLNR